MEHETRRRFISEAIESRMRAELMDVASGGTYSNVEEPPPFSLQRIRESMLRVQREFGPPIPPFKIVESPYAMQRGARARTYPKRKAKSHSHWRRMDKKWLKRYGFKQVPCIIKADTSYITGRPGVTLVVHPSIAPQLYADIARGFVP